MNIVSIVLNWYTEFMYLPKGKDVPHDIPPADQTEPTFTTVLLSIIDEYLEHKSVDGAKPHITRMEDNRFLWQSGKLTMSVTINDVSREYM